MTRILVLDKDARSMIAERKPRGLNRYDEVWDGVYVMPSLPKNVHQEIVLKLGVCFDAVVDQEGRGKSYPGANVSDRVSGWKRNYRCPDLVVVLNESRAVDCDTHFYGGPDLVVEIKTPGDETEDKIPFYSRIADRELLIIYRDKRTVRLLRHDGEELIDVEPSSLDGKSWLVSEVIPLAFRQMTSNGVPRTEVRRTDGKGSSWTI